ncbi:MULTISPECIES: hypothetical protein [Planktothrix]|nr:MULTISPECIES: hypothetical protein [Planktothrix]
MPSRKIILWLATALLVVMAIIGIDTFNKRNQETITIAIAAPLSQVGKATETVGESMVRGVQLYVDQINKAGGIQGKRLRHADLTRDNLITGSGLEYSQFNAVIDIKRDLLSFSIKNLLPLWFFVAVAYLLLFLPFEQLSVEALSGLLLAVVFYHLSLLQALPDGVGYVVALDYAFYLERLPKKLLTF